MIDSWMDRSFGWLTSIGLHVVLLLGVTLVVVEQGVHASGSVGGGFNCAIVGRGPFIDRIDRPYEASRSWAQGSTECIEFDWSSTNDPVVLLAEELASVFKRGERSSGCVLCNAENRHGKVLLPRNIGPAGLCCRHVMLLESGPPRER